MKLVCAIHVALQNMNKYNGNDTTNFQLQWLLVLRWKADKLNFIVHIVQAIFIHVIAKIIFRNTETIFNLHWKLAPVIWPCDRN
jgi:hypothetical protein